MTRFARDAVLEEEGSGGGVDREVAVEETSWNVEGGRG